MNIKTMNRLSEIESKINKGESTLISLYSDAKKNSEEIKKIEQLISKLNSDRVSIIYYENRPLFRR